MSNIGRQVLTSHRGMQNGLQKYRVSKKIHLANIKRLSFPFQEQSLCLTSTSNRNFSGLSRYICIPNTTGYRSRCVNCTCLSFGRDKNAKCYTMNWHIFWVWKREVTGNQAWRWSHHSLNPSINKTSVRSFPKINFHIDNL